MLTPKKQSKGIIQIVPEKYSYRDKDYSASRILAELEQTTQGQEQTTQGQDEAGYVLELMIAVDSLSKIVDGLVSRIEVLETRRKLIR